MQRNLQDPDTQNQQLQEEIEHLQAQASQISGDQQPNQSRVDFEDTIQAYLVPIQVDPSFVEQSYFKKLLRIWMLLHSLS